MLYTSNQSLIVVSVVGVTLDSKSWDKFSGAGHTMDTQNYPPGGMQPSIATGGVSKRNTAAISRAWDDTLIGMYLDLDNALGAAFSCSVAPLKNKSSSASAKRSFTGILKEVNPPESDSSSSTVQMLELVVELNETISG